MARPLPPDQRAHRSGRAWRALRAQVIARDVEERRARCWWCGHVVDVTLSGDLPAGPSVDHLLAIEHGGDEWDPDNLGLMHRRCNTAKGVRPISEAPVRQRGRGLGRTSREW